MARAPINQLLNGVTRFGRLTVVGEATPYKWGNREFRLVECLCDCGVSRQVQPAKLRNGQTLSCGCYAADQARRANRTHGMAGTPEYVSWRGMRNRCNNPRDPYYREYGGRGIRVCEEWQGSFEAFYSDMGPRPAGMTLDRIDNDGPYSPENCRWSTNIEQASNTRAAHLITYQGRKITLSEASRLSGLSRSSIRKRIGMGWAIEKALHTPASDLGAAGRASKADRL